MLQDLTRDKIIKHDGGFFSTYPGQQVSKAFILCVCAMVMRESLSTHELSIALSWVATISTTTKDRAFAVT